MVTVRVWDLPTRLFHWLLAACVVGLVITGKLGGNAAVAVSLAVAQAGAAYSGLTPALFTTRAHFEISARQKASSSVTDQCHKS